MYGAKIKHFDREREMTVIETQDEKDTTLCSLWVATLLMLMPQHSAFT